MSKHDALIFDLDGTLWNASPSTAKGWTKALKQLGIDRTISPKEIESVAGRPYLECVNTLIPHPPLPLERIIPLFDLEERGALKRGGDFLYDQIIPILSKLSESHKLFLVSNCQDWYLTLFLDQYKLESTFVETTCHGMTDLPKSKMITDLVEKHQLGSPVYVGDTIGDHKAAKESGVLFAFAQYGFGEVEGYDYLLKSTADLLDL